MQSRLLVEKKDFFETFLFEIKIIFIKMMIMPKVVVTLTLSTCVRVLQVPVGEEREGVQLAGVRQQDQPAAGPGHSRHHPAQEGGHR